MPNPSLDGLTPFKDFIVVINDNYEEERMVRLGWDGHTSERVPATKKYSGDPYQVLGVSIPFICCKHIHDEHTFQIDNRHVQWRYVSDNYVKGYMVGNGILKPAPTEEDIQQQKDEKRRCCPICVESMTERKGTKTGWSMICKSCDVQLTRIDK